MRTLRSPNGQIEVSVEIPPPGSPVSPTWSASFRGRRVLEACGVGLSIRGEGDVLSGAQLLGSRERLVDERIRVYFGKASAVSNRFRELRLSFARSGSKRIDLVLRCFDDAVALRYEIPRQKGFGRVAILDEHTSFGFSGDPNGYVQYLEHHKTSHEHNVTVVPWKDIKPDALIDLPATFAYEGGTCVAITEAALVRYAGMSLTRKSPSAGTPALFSVLTPREDGAKVVLELPVRSPWRVALVGESPGRLLESHVIYCLNDPPAIGDTSWIKPGKMTWPWWNGNLYGPQPAQPILSLSMQRKYIDFCAEHGIDYHAVVSDEQNTPWYHQPNPGFFPGPETNPSVPKAGLDLQRVRAYADLKGVRLWTWVHNAALRGRVEEAFSAYEKLGWRGMMIDFFDHDDQHTVEFAEEILQAAARHKILIHFHGIWKPTGVQRKYPNLMNHEGALNLEYLKWSSACPPEHDLLMAFTRLIAGPMDYHLGGFRAVKRADFKPKFVGPNVLGTRCHQLAMYVCFDNPNPMVADFPEAYSGQPGFGFVKAVPTWWDETRVLAAEIGRLLVTARRRGRTWYVGALSAGPAREVFIPLGFLGSGAYTARTWTDAADSDEDPNRLRSDESPVTAREALRARLAQDGGFVAQLEPLAARRPRQVIGTGHGL